MTGQRPQELSEMAKEMTEETRKSAKKAPRLLLILNVGWVFCVILLGLFPDDRLSVDLFLSALISLMMILLGIVLLVSNTILVFVALFKWMARKEQPHPVTSKAPESLLMLTIGWAFCVILQRLLVGNWLSIDFLLDILITILVFFSALSSWSPTPSLYSWHCSGGWREKNDRIRLLSCPWSSCWSFPFWTTKYRRDRE